MDNSYNLQWVNDALVHELPTTCPHSFTPCPHCAAPAPLQTEDACGATTDFLDLKGQSLRVATHKRRNRGVVFLVEIKKQPPRIIVKLFEGVFFRPSNNLLRTRAFPLRDSAHSHVRHPFILKPTQSLHGSARFEHRRSKTFLLGEPFSFSRGVQDGESRVSVIRLSGEWLERTVRQVFALRSIFSIGIDALDATVNKDAPDSRFLCSSGKRA